ncbi:alpha/beta fold hydrolase [Rhodanobacter sp. L36]|uniref:alpha/beta fold hydrolase n=1 Tax=Rhodanobacter sp. L36 TaxID=1747221 RepID=UPI00131DCAF4|nr:alpha/beta fold hydrolase [Rhodanobacter sp. L36]
MKASRLAFRILSVVVLLVGMPLAFGVTLFATFQAAKMTANIPLLVALTLVACFLCTFCIGLLAARLWAGRKSRRTAFVVAAICTVLFATGLELGVFRPVQYPHVAAVVRSHTQYWTLPSGSHIAYSVYEPPAGVAIKPDPIVFLHGGPGLRATDLDHAFYGQFARDGFRVYLYDQAGSGLSNQLPKASDYTVERFVTDLEQIRQRIGAERMILIGHSWGGTLAAHYVAAYPEHVSKLVFHSPGPVWFPKFTPMDMQRTAQGNVSQAMSARVIAALALSYANVNASENLVSQSELGDWGMTTLDPRQLICSGESAKQIADVGGVQMAGMNMYPLLVTTNELKQPRMNVLSRLVNIHVPAIVLEGECDFIPWSEHAQYLQSIIGIKSYYFPNAGHDIKLSQPERLAALIRSFLLDQPAPFAARQGLDDPRPPMKAPATP